MTKDVRTRPWMWMRLQSFYVRRRMRMLSSTLRVVCSRGRGWPDTDVSFWGCQLRIVRILNERWFLLCKGKLDLNMELG